MPCLRPRYEDSPPLPGWLQHYVERYIGRPPLWIFPDLPPSGRLAFVRLDFDIRAHVLAMFRDDPNPFVDASFKDPVKLYEYVAHNRICGPYSPKRGGADWIICLASGEPVGILHAYDISREDISLRHRWCAIGYAIAEPYRGQGIAREAVESLQTYLFTEFDMLMLLAFPKRRNEASIRLLERLGYIDNSADYSDETCRFFERYRTDEARQQFEDMRRQSDRKYGKPKGLAT